MRVVLMFLLACGGEAEQRNLCDAICDELVMACAYDAYPTRDSCMQGCLYKAEQGANMGRAKSCVMNADCDTFAIIECEHAEGVQSE
jgi:hypothetical protein